MENIFSLQNKKVIIHFGQTKNIISLFIQILQLTFSILLFNYKGRVFLIDIKQSMIHAVLFKKLI